MDSKSRWLAIGGMLGVLVILFLITPKSATSFALIILLTLIGFGYQKGAFSIKGVK